MVFGGVLLAVLSGICNGLFTAPMKLASAWKWENIRLIFILVACVAMPVAMVFAVAPGSSAILGGAPWGAVATAMGSPAGYIFAIVSGGISAIFIIGYTLALPIASS